VSVPPRALALFLVGAASWAVGPTAVRAQETEGGGQASRGCRLVLVPGSDSTRSLSRQVAPGQYVTHWSGGLHWTCGTSAMTADSAIKYDLEHRVEAIGAVHYRDSVRTLTADSLTYWQDEDRLVAAGNVHLVRLKSKSELRGPRVEFFRPGGSGPQRTVATGRPHMIVRDTTGKGPPAEIDADRMVFRGEEEAHLSGDVRIVRGDTRARADSAVYVDREHVGRLLGSPVVTREDFRLAGKTIAAEVDSGKVHAVQARGEAEAEGESFRLFSDAIDARVADEKIDRLWAHGERPSLAVSAPYRMDGDSLVFAFRDGDIDTLKAMGRASAVEVGDSASTALAAADRASPPPAAAGEENWVRGDTLVLAFEPADTAADTAGERNPADSVGTLPPDTAGARLAEGDTTPGAPPDTAAGARQRRLELIRAIGSARAYYLVPRDSAGASRPARNYLLGREVTVFFVEGKADRVDGVDAIGVFLDAEEADGGQAPPGGGRPPVGGAPPGGGGLR